ncbi:ParM/StbA family protein [Pseudomonas sp. P66]|uniref:ParM/StbA family protein n=1 Tax=Pseudomonas arcuscaelestis TaxID=2710591 RepID=A0ABS2BYS9_9PSED|nr:ParM/StbA family protein [Pseudomonas arcuscaelestis]MBM5458772.1 ParM/StbA family protein [Pseudomonas arcuscaelestis]
MSQSIDQLIAVDLGNGTTSYIAGAGDIKGSFASLVAPAQSSQGLGGGFARESFKTKFGSFYIGDDCREDGATPRSTDSSYYSSDTIKVLFLKVLKEVGQKHPIIVTGLPTEFFKSRRADFAADLKRWAIEEGYQPANVVVLPQYVGPWFDPELLDPEGKRIDPKVVMEGKLGIIDIGQGTIDAGQFVDGKVSSDDKLRYGESSGVSDIHKKLFTQLKQVDALNSMLPAKARLPKDFALDNQTTEYTMDTWLRKGYIPWRGSRIDIEPISLPARQEFAEDVLVRCIKAVWGTTDFLAGMVAAGGGAVVLGAKLLGTYINTRIYMAKDPENSIVRGYHRFYVTQNFKDHARVKVAQRD